MVELVAIPCFLCVVGYFYTRPGFLAQLREELSRTSLDLVCVVLLAGQLFRILATWWPPVRFLFLACTLVALLWLTLLYVKEG